MLGRRSLPLLASALRQATSAKSPSALRAVARAPAMSPASGRAFYSRTPVLLGKKDAAAEEKQEAAAQAEMAKSDEFASLSGNPPAKLKELADQILALNMVETAEIVMYLKQKLGVTDAMLFSGGGGGGGGGAPAGGGGAAAAEAAPAKEKTEFTLKLDSFNAPDKLKVIKEIRGITGLGLKESKEMVEGAPAVVKEGVTKEDGEKFLKAIEAAGGKASLS